MRSTQLRYPRAPYRLSFRATIGPHEEQPEMDRYLLQVDRQTKRSFKTAEAARSRAASIFGRDGLQATLQ